MLQYNVGSIISYLVVKLSFLFFFLFVVLLSKAVQEIFNLKCKAYQFPAV